MNTSLNRRYDLRGLEVPRLIKLAVLGKYVPMGNFRGGPGARCLAVLTILHYLGYPLYLLAARHGHRLRLLRRLAGKFRG